MERHFHEELAGLKRTMTGMGGIAERMIEEAIRLLLEKDTSVLPSIEAGEAEVDRLQRAVDEECARLIARFQPTASDLRFILGCVRANVEIERMADLAINVSHKAQRLLETRDLRGLETIASMAGIAAPMGRDGIGSYVEGDVDLAREVIRRDAKLDALKAEATAVLTRAMAADPAVIPRALDAALVARNLERIGDHAKNVAEQTIYVVEGRDVRHV
jgi:phosphate transport system protein